MPRTRRKPIIPEPDGPQDEDLTQAEAGQADVAAEAAENSAEQAAQPQRQAAEPESGAPEQASQQPQATAPPVSVRVARAMGLPDAE